MLDYILSLVIYRVLLLLVVFHQNEVNVHNDPKKNVTNIQPSLLNMQHVYLTREHYFSCGAWRARASNFRLAGKASSFLLECSQLEHSHFISFNLQTSTAQLNV